MHNIIYLAAPYTDVDPAVRKRRFEAVTKYAAHLIEQEMIVFSPITMTHPIDLIMAKENETLGSDFWVRFDEAFMAVCSRLFVLCLPGWQESSGVQREIEFFRDQGKTIVFIAEEIL